MSNDNFSKNSKAWFEKADHDLGAAFIMLRDGSFNDTICFHTEQAVEKAIKGFMVSKGIIPERIHNLVKLSEKIKPLLPEIVDYEKEIAILNDYYISSRYPSDAPVEYSKQEAKEAIEYAKEIVKFIKSKI